MSATKFADFTIGADPEFICTTASNSVICAEEFCGNNINESFGCDGNGVLFEVRPTPSKNPLAVLGNIHKIFSNQVLKHPEFLKYNWMAGSYCSGYPMGGHIHFGVKNYIADYQRVVTILDNYVGALSVLIDSPELSSSRRAKGYGSMGDYRTQPYGFEYRTPGSWLSSPYVSAVMLCLAKTVVFEAINNSTFYNSFFSCISADDMYFSRRCGRAKILKKFPGLWADIIKMNLYQVYKPYIDLLYHMISTNLSWTVKNNDMKDSWGLFGAKPPTYKIPLNLLWLKFRALQRH
jgi:hypothetical protein